MIKTAVEKSFSFEESIIILGPFELPARVSAEKQYVIPDIIYSKSPIHSKKSFKTKGLSNGSLYDDLASILVWK